jgi:hypothetical protein
LGVPYANFITGSGDGLDVELMQLFARHYCGEDATGKPCQEANLENVFIKLTGRQLRE